VHISKTAAQCELKIVYEAGAIFPVVAESRMGGASPEVASRDSMSAAA